MEIRCGKLSLFFWCHSFFTIGYEKEDVGDGVIFRDLHLGWFSICIDTYGKY